MTAQFRKRPPSSARLANRWGYLAVVAVILALSSPVTHLAATGGAPQAGGGQPVINGVAPSAMAQIAALMAEKESRTPAQQKIDSQLIYAARMASGLAITSGVATLEIAIPQTPDNRAIVDVRATVSDGLLDELRALGAEITDTDVEYHHVGAYVALDRIEAIAGIPDVVFIAPAAQAITQGFAGTAPRRPLESLAPMQATKARKKLDRAALLASVQRALQDQGPVTNIGPNLTEGDITHRAGGASGARASFGIDGTGVKIGVLSDGVNSLAASQMRGDLGTVTVVPGQSGNGDEGTAMLEIVHDLAPGAQLFYATAMTSSTVFAGNIRTLRTTYACDIIIDDVFYFSETPFQDGQASGIVTTTNGGVIAQAVKDVVAAGALYFSAAGNEGRLNAGTSGTWEGDFADGGAVTSPEAGNILSFGATNYDTINSTGFAHTLHWSDPLGGSANDYDLFRLNSTGTSVLTSSTNVQSGTQDPFEIISAGSVNDRIVIVKKTGAAGRFLHLGALRGTYSVATAGEIHGHAAVNSPNAYGVAATPACAGAGSTGPCTTTFVSTNLAENFSSDGPRRIFYNSNGSAITPGNFSATGGLVLAKPDITAADGVTTGVTGFNPFFGTSAAAPHAGAIAALVKSRNLSLTPAQISTALTSTAIDIYAAGWDRDSGVGIVMAFQSVNSVPPGGSPPAVTLNPTSTTVFTGRTIFFSANATGSPTPTAQWQVSTNGGASWVDYPGATSYNLSFAAERNDNGKRYRCLFTNTGGSAPTAAASLTVQLRVPTDLDNDRKSDLMVWRPGNGYWFWLYSASGYNTATAGNKQWGSGPLGDVPLSGDVDGDGLADLVVWRASDGKFYLLTSSTGYDYNQHIERQWGSSALGDVPFLGDIDGDGKADLIVWRPGTGTWFWLTSSSGYTVQGSKQWGNQSLGDKPLLGDFDGDGLVDLGIWRASSGTFFWLTSSSGYAYGSQGNKQWGNASLGDMPLIADMDGDGVSDLIVWRASTSTYFWLTSLSGYNYAAQGQKQWGSQAQSDVPMVGDLDGDGVADLVVWRPGTGTWFWLTSSTGYSYASQMQKQWGTSGDLPILK